jgi:hypothetical protein
MNPLIPFLGLAATPLVTWLAATTTEHTRNRRAARAAADTQELLDIDHWLAAIREDTIPMPTTELDEQTDFEMDLAYIRGLGALLLAEHADWLNPPATTLEPPNGAKTRWPADRAKGQLKRWRAQLNDCTLGQ